LLSLIAAFLPWASAGSFFERRAGAFLRFEHELQGLKAPKITIAYVGAKAPTP